MASAERRRVAYVEALEDRRLLSVTTAYVAPAAAFTDATNPGNPQPGDTVTWNGGGQFTAPVGGLIFGTNAFTSINTAAANVSSGGTVKVAPGTYSETVDINTPMTLQGAQFGVDATTGRLGASESILDAAANSGKTQFVVSADDVTIDGFTVTNEANTNVFGSAIYISPGHHGTHVVNDIVEDNQIGLNLVNDSGSDQAVVQHDLFQNNNQPGAGSGNGIYLDQFAAGGAVTNVLIDSNSFIANGNSTNGGAGIGFSSTSGSDQTSNVTISNNLFDGNYNGLYAYETVNSAITGNTIENSGQDGIGFYGDDSNDTITGNIITNSDTDNIVPYGSGIEIGSYNDSTPNSNITINDNSISNQANGAHDLQLDPNPSATFGTTAGAYTGTLDARQNWWGTNDAATIQGDILGTAAFSPFLDNGNNSVASGPGFQGDLTHLDVSSLSPQLGSVGPIEQAVQAAAAGGTVNVGPGTYDEHDIVINKALTLNGPNAGINPNTGTRGAEAIIDAQLAPNLTAVDIVANNVTVNGFTVQGGASAGIAMSPATSGVDVLDNIVTNNSIGIYGDSNGPSKIQDNLITGNNVAGAAGGAGLYSDGTNGLTIDSNVFTNQTINSAIIFAASASNVHQNLKVTNNVINNPAPGNSAIYVVAVQGGEFADNDITTQNTGTALHFAGDDTGISVHNNNFNDVTNGVAVTDDGYGLGNNATITVNYNSFTNASAAALSIGAGGYTGTLDASKNWWGAISGPTIASNVGGTGQVLNDPNGQVTYRPWLIYGTDANPAAAGFQLPSIVPVTSQGDVSPAVNDFTILQNAVGAAATGQTIDLSGAFNWTAPLASAAYSLSTNTAPTNDIRGVALPDGVNNLTITSSAANASITGPGDSTDSVYNTFLFSAVSGAGATGNNNLTVSNLNIDNFMSGVTLGWNNGGTFNGTLVEKNTITVAADNNNSLSDVQGIAVYFWSGQNQRMTGNTIDFMGDGTRGVGTGARSYGFQDGTTGGTGYNGLSIDNNTFKLLPSAVGGSEVVTGIWENGHNDDNASHISIADNQFVGIQGPTQRLFDIGLQLSSQTTNMSIDGNTFTDVKYVFWVGPHNGDVTGDQFTFTNNVLMRVGDANGVFLQNVDAVTPATITINWNTNNTIDGFKGIRGLNELSVQATGQSRPSGAATDLNAVDGVGSMPVDFVNTNWGSPPRFTNPLTTPDGTPGPIAYGFNTFTTVQDGVNAVDAGGTTNVLPGTYAESVTIDKNLTLSGITATGGTASPPTAIIQPAGGDGITIAAPATTVTVNDLDVTGATNGVNASGVATVSLNNMLLEGNATGFAASNATTLNLTNLTLTGNTSAGGTISNVTTVNDTPITGGTGATDTITGSTIQRGTDDEVNYSGVANLNVTGSDGSDTFDVTPATATTISINGGLPTPPAAPGDTLNVNTAGATSPSLSYTSTANGYQGSFTFGNARPVNFQGIETLANVPNLTITKTDNSPTPGFVVPGSPLTYTIVVSNAGPGTASGASVTDTFPLSLTGATYTATASGGATDSAPSGSGAINDTVTLPSGSSITYVVTGTVDPTATGTLTNQATVSLTSPVAETSTATDSDVLTPQTDLSITKTDNSPFPGHVFAGTSLTYTITVKSSGPSTVTGATVTDNLPADFTGATYTATATGGATGYTAIGTGSINDTVDMPAGSTITYLVSGTIAPAATGTVSNTASVTAPLGMTDTNGANNVATDSGTVSTLADLSITKSDSAGGSSVTNTTGSVAAGTSLTYTIVVSNAGPSPVTAATVADTFPTGYTVTSSTPSLSGGASITASSGVGGNINDTVNLPSGSSITYVVTGTVAASATGSLSNTATVTAPADTADTNLANNTATDSDTITTQATLFVSKTDNKGGDSTTSTTGSVAAGTPLTYTIVVSNAGPSDVTGATVADTFPAGFTAGTYTATATGTASGFTASGSGNISDTVNLPAGTSITYVVSGTVAPAATGTLSNKATITPTSGAPVSATDTDTITTQAALSVSKTDNKGGDSTTSTTGSVVAGTPLTYTIVVSNAGPSDLTGATVADTFPAGFTAATYTATATGTASGFTASGSGNISDTVNLPAGTSITYVVTGTVASSATGTLSNKVTVTPTSGSPVSATDADTVTTQATLSVSKLDNKGGDSTTSTTGSVVAGTPMTYTIVVSNAGPSDVTGAMVADTFPAGFTAATYTATGTGTASGYTASGSGNISDTVNLPAGTSITYVVTGTVAPSASGTLSNKVTVTPTSGAPVSATDADTVTTQATVSVSKKDNKGGDSTTSTTGSVVAGTALTYTIVVSNAGPSDVTGATVADTFPAGFTAASYTATATGTASGFTANGSGNISDTVNLPAGTSITYVVTGTVASSATGTLSNKATITPTSGAAVTATDTDTITTQAAISVSKTDNKGGDSTTSTPGSVAAGTAMTYTIVVRNTGPSDVTGATLADTFPTGFTSATYTVATTGGATSSVAGGVGAINDTVSVPVGGSVTFTVSGTVSASASGTLSNTATVTPTSGSAVSATDTDTITAQSGVSISKKDNKGGNSSTATSGSVAAGATMTYTIVVDNSGPSNVTGATVTDTLPAGFKVTSATPVATGGAAITASTGTGGNIDDTVNLPAGGSIAYVVTGTVATSATGTLSNAASVTLPNGVTNTGNLSATDTDTITAQSGVTVTKSDNKGGNSATSTTGSVTAGSPMTYTIVVSNSGPSDVTGATVADTFPVNFAMTGVTPSFVGGAKITSSTQLPGSNIINDTVTLPAGSSITYVVSGIVSGSASGSLSNTASVTLPNGVTNTGNLSATDTDTISRQAFVSVTKTDDKGGSSATGSTGSVAAGASMTYIVVVSNGGPADVTGATVADTFPTGFTVTSVTPSLVGGSSITSQAQPPIPNGIFDTVNLPAGSSITYVVTGTVSASASGSLSNTATVTLPAGVTSSGSLTATDTDTVGTQGGVTVTKSDNKGGNSSSGASGSVLAGTAMTYTIVVSNSGPSNVTGATISDTFPSGFMVASFTATATGGATGFSASGSGNVHDTVNLPLGSSVTYVVTGTVSSSASGSLSNTANVTLPSGATNSGNLSATDTDKVTTAPPPPGSGYLAGVPGDGTDQTFVQNLYRELLGREPDAPGDAGWLGYLASHNTVAGRQTVIEGFLNSAEYKAHYITTLYEVFLGRAPEASGLAFWTGKMGNPGTPGQNTGSADEKYILAAIVGSDEFYAKVGGTPDAFANALYQDLMGRPGDTAGVAYWASLVSGQPGNRDGIVRMFLSSPEVEHQLLDSFYPAPGGTASNPLPSPGTGLAAGAYDLARVTGDGWENLYLQGPFDRSPEGNDAFFAELAAGTGWDDVQLDILTTSQFYNNPNRPVTS